jgi:hypothetical protein
MNPLLWIIILPLLGWRIYARLRRNIGEQAFQPTRLRIYIGMFVVLTAGCAFLSRGHPPVMLGWIAGLAGGVLLGFWSLRLTSFITIAAGRFYTPNARLGIALSVLFVIRIIYRVIAIYSHFSVAGRPAPPWGQSALTDLTFELLAGYYITYYAGVLAWYAREDRPPDPVA